MIGKQDEMYPQMHKSTNTRLSGLRCGAILNHGLGPMKPPQQSTKLLTAILGTFVLACCSHIGNSGNEWEFITPRTLLPVRVGSVWGYVDRYGAVKIKPQFKEAGDRK